MLLENIPLKLVSLGLAAMLWFVIAGEKTSEMGVSAPLELQNFPKDLEVTGEPVDNVEVRLRASPGIIQRIGPGDVSAQLDLAGLQEGEHIVHLTDKSIRMPVRREGRQDHALAPDPEPRAHPAEGGAGAAAPGRTAGARASR
jgi:hypothetical protein